jgi:hypothetical protein
MTIAYHGSANLFSRFDAAHLLEGAAKCRFGVGAYLTSRYASAAHYAGASGRPEKYVYTAEIPDLREGNHIFSALPVPDGIVARAEEKLGVPVPEEARSKGKYFRKWIGNTLVGEGNTVNQRIGKASLEAEKAASAFLLGIGVEILVWPTAQSRPDAGNNYAVLDFGSIRILKVDSVELDGKDQLVEGSQKTVIEY